MTKDFNETAASFFDRWPVSAKETYDNALSSIKYLSGDDGPGNPDFQEWLNDVTEPMVLEGEYEDQEAIKDQLMQALAISIADNMREGHLEYIPSYNDDFSAPKELSAALNPRPSENAQYIGSEFATALEDNSTLEQWRFEAEGYDESWLRESVESKLEKTFGFDDSELSSYVFSEILLNMPDYYYDLGLESRALECEYRTTVYLGTDTDRACDFTNTYAIANNNSYNLTTEDIENCMLTYLIHQQGYSWSDILQETEKSSNPFPESVREELLSGYDVGALVVLLNMPGNDLVALRSESLKEDPDAVFTLPIKRTPTIGLYDPFNGGGSCLEIVLEKPLEIPASMILGMDIKGAPELGRYDLDDVYGLCGDTWVELDIDDLDFKHDPDRIAELMNNFKGETIEDIRSYDVEQDKTQAR